MTATADHANELRSHFGRSARYRFLFLLLRPPAPGRREELRALAGEIPWEEHESPPPLISVGDEDVAREAFRLIGQEGSVSACASDYVEDGYADKGPILADVAGFYRAFGFEPTLAENPDHFATMFEFLAFLALKQAWSESRGEPEQRDIAAEAERKMTAEHVLPYLARFAERLDSAVPEGGAYEAVARHVSAFAASRELT